MFEKISKMDSEILFQELHQVVESWNLEQLLYNELFQLQLMLYETLQQM